MIWIGMLADCKDPNDPQGRSYRQVNAEKKHAIPLGALVEIMDTENDDFPEDDYSGVRLYVVYHARDCDQTPLYCLAWNRHDTLKQNARFYNSTWLTGYPEESLRIINLP